MKQNICVVIFLLLSTICKAQTFIYPQNDSILTEYNDGKFWAYLNKNDFVVGLSCFEEKDDYGKYYHLDIFIKNLSETPIVFQPDSVHSNLLTKKDDTLKLEVYTNEEYQKKNKNAHKHGLWHYMESLPALMQEQQDIQHPILRLILLMVMLTLP